VRLACSTASFPEDRLQIAVAKVAWAGYPAVELALRPGSLPDEDEARDWLRANELELAAVHAGEIPARGEADLGALADVGRAAALARALDGGVVVLRAPVEGSLAGLARSLSLLDAALGDLAVDLCLANHRGTLLQRAEDLQALWSHGLPRRIGTALDPGQALLAGWEPRELEALPVPPGHVYLNDADGERVVPPGEGSLDLTRLGRALREAGYAGSVSLVLENANPWEVEPLARELPVRAADWLDAE
jgi:sugar phosphate isomerase/epimerase